jgi:hypothetical protein
MNDGSFFEIKINTEFSDMADCLQDLHPRNVRRFPALLSLLTFLKALYLFAYGVKNKFIEVRVFVVLETSILLPSISD